MDDFVHEMDRYYLNQLIENDNFIEHAKVSAGLPFEKYFKNVVLMNDRADTKKFQNTCKLIFGKLIKGTEVFCAKLSLVKISFTALNHKMQKYDLVVNTVVKLFPDV